MILSSIVLLEVFYECSYAEVFVIEFNEADVVGPDVKQKQLFVEDILCESLRQVEYALHEAHH